MMKKLPEQFISSSQVENSLESASVTKFWKGFENKEWHLSHCKEQTTVKWVGSTGIYDWKQLNDEDLTGPRPFVRVIWCILNRCILN